MNDDNRSGESDQQPIPESLGAKSGETLQEKVAKPPHAVSWDELSGPAESMFGIWMAGSEVAWAKAAWSALEKKGLAKYSNEVERTIVLIRFVILAVMYREFCHVSGLEEEEEPEFGDWADALEISQFRLGQLASREFETSETSENDAVEQAFSYLVNQNRREVFDALVEGFGSVSGLFASLWVTPQAGIDPANLDDETLNEILNDDLTGEKLSGFQWVDGGMPSVWS